LSNIPAPDRLSKKKRRRLHVFQRANFKCEYCGRKIDLSSGRVEHKVPRSRGGTSCASNLLAACTVCDTEKTNLSDDEYRLVLAHRKSHLPRDNAGSADGILNPKEPTNTAHLKVDASLLASQLNEMLGSNCDEMTKEGLGNLLGSIRDALENAGTIVLVRQEKSTIGEGC